MYQEKTVPFNALDTYPYNMPAAVKGLAEWDIPVALSDDHRAGIHYVLGLPDEWERGILLQHYKELLCCWLHQKSKHHIKLGNRKDHSK